MKVYLQQISKGLILALALMIATVGLLSCKAQRLAIKDQPIDQGAGFDAGNQDYDQFGTRAPDEFGQSDSNSGSSSNSSM